MRTTMDRKELVKALQTVKPAVPLRPMLPILSNVLLQAGPDKLTVTGTNMTHAIEVTVPATTEQGGSTLTNCKGLLDTVKSIAGESICLEMVDGMLSIAVNGSRFALPIDDPDSFPLLAFVTNTGISRGLLSPAFIEKAGNAGKFIATERSRIALTGVYMEFGKRGVEITATDSHYLAHYELPECDGKEYNCILPLFPLAQISKHKKEEWLMYVGMDRVTFSSGSIRIMSKLIEGLYPNYKQVIPVGNPNTMTIDKLDLLQAITGLLPCVPKETGQIRFDFSGDNGLKLSASNADTGAQGDKRLCCTYSGQNQALAYNGRLVETILESITADEVLWTTSDPKSAAMIYPAGNGESYLLMPLRLHD